jgi:hypothetical protein
MWPKGGSTPKASKMRYGSDGATELVRGDIGVTRLYPVLLVQAALNESIGLFAS